MRFERRLLTVVVLALIALSMLPAQPAAAEATTIVCHGTLTFAGFQEGDVRITGERMHIRGRIAIYNTEFPDCPWLDGTNTVVSNVNWEPVVMEPFIVGFGPVWGTFNKAASAYPDTGFSGTYTGKATPEGMFVETVGHGYGAFEGMKVFGTIEYANPMVGTATMHILDPHGEWLPD